MHRGISVVSKYYLNTTVHGACAQKLVLVYGLHNAYGQFVQDKRAVRYILPDWLKFEVSYFLNIAIKIYFNSKHKSHMLVDYFIY